MVWLISSLAVVALGLAAVVGAGRWGEMPEVVDDRPVPRLPEGRLASEDLRQARFAVVTRGYAPLQVDELLERVAVQMDEDSSEAVIPTGVDAPRRTVHDDSPNGTLSVDAE